MSDFSDIVLLMGAMVAFSLLSATTARTFQSTTDSMVRAELEYRAIATAQGIIDEARWISDEDKVFTNSGTNSFFKDYPKSVTLTYGENDEYVSHLEVDGSSTMIYDSATLRQYLIEVIVVDDVVTPPITDTLRYVKSFNQ